MTTTSLAYNIIFSALFIYLVVNIDPPPPSPATIQSYDDGAMWDLYVGQISGSMLMATNYVDKEG